MWTQGWSEFEWSSTMLPRIFSSRFRLNDTQSSGSYVNNPDAAFGISAPTFSQAFRWFRDKRGLVSWISFRIDLKKKYLWYITDVKNIAARDGDYIFDILIESYEEAELACLKKLIEIANEQR